MTKFNETTLAAIALFAKTNKVAKAKVEAFAAELAAEFKPAGGGRTASEETIVLRDRFMAYASGVDTFTSLEAAQALGCRAVEVNNCIMFFNRDADVFIQVGKAEKAEGVRGRKPTIWAKAK